MQQSFATCFNQKCMHSYILIFWICFSFLTNDNGIKTCVHYENIGFLFYRSMPKNAAFILVTCIALFRSLPTNPLYVRKKKSCKQYTSLNITTFSQCLSRLVICHCVHLLSVRKCVQTLRWPQKLLIIMLWWNKKSEINIIWF